MPFPVGIAVSAGLGALGGILGGKPEAQKTTSTSTSTYQRDPESQAALEMARNRYMAQYRQQPTATDRQLMQ